jgi:guanylate kinase
MSHENNPSFNPPSKPLLIIISGLSGVGKDAVLSRLKQSKFPLEFITTVTTRPPRPGEKNGVHYHFISEKRFQEMVDRHELLEWATVYGHHYGPPVEPVRKALTSGKDVIIKVDVQGAATIKKIVPQAVFIFLATSSLEEVGERLQKRRTETSADLELRLKTAREEMEQLPVFDYIVYNRPGELESAVADIEAIIAAEKCRVTPREISL